MTDKIKNIFTYFIQTFVSLISKNSSSEEKKHPTPNAISGNNYIASGSHNRAKISRSNVAGGDVNIFNPDKNDDDGNTVTILAFGLIYFVAALCFILVVLLIVL